MRWESDEKGIKRMSENLDLLKKEIEDYLQEGGFVIFHGEPQLVNGDNAIYWQTERHPDYKQFLSAAKALGLKLIVVQSKDFSEAELQAVVDELAESEIPRDERRTYESQLEDMRLYVGLTCSLELSFSYEGRSYVFWRETDWYDEFNQIAEMIELSETPYEEGNSMGGFYSNN